nr:unnamed protein product [Spirometra erinaceieuropaei]
MPRRTRAKRRKLVSTPPPLSASLVAGDAEEFRLGADMETQNDVPVDAPAACPGTSSDTAGRASACAGCPNQSLCASGAAKLSLEEREPEVVQTIRRRLARVKRCLFVLSGKGGVGKSSVTVCLARGLTQRQAAARPMQVGVLDLDLCGPSIPCLMGCLDAQVHQSAQGWSPVFVNENLSLMSLGFLTDPDQAIIWRGPRKNAFIRDLLCNVAWMEEQAEAEGAWIDFLLIDTPPGTSDEHLSAVPYLKVAGCPCAALIVTTPQEVALSDVRKEINFCEKVGLPILGIVENMSAFECPKCHVSSPLFPTTTGGAASLCVGRGGGGDGTTPGVDLPLLGRIPLDPLLTRCLDEGLCPFEEASQSDQPCEQHLEGSPLGIHGGLHVIRAYRDLVESVITNFDRKFASTQSASC